MAAPEGAAEPFPAVVDDNAPSAPASPRAPGSDAPTGDVKDRKNSSSSLGYRLRRVSQSFGESSLPEGFTAATGDIASSIFSGRIPAVSDTTSPLHAQRSPTSGTVPKSTLSSAQVAEQRASAEHGTGALLGHDGAAPPAAAPFANGYHFPPSRSFGESAKTGAIAFWKYFLTPLGFCVTIYGLNVVAWGGMLFLLLCNASPAMCYPSCNDIESPRRKWIEYTSQILNALFCVTGFGLAPWRFRDLYYLLQYRVMKKQLGLRRLAAIHNGWLRLPGSDTIPADIGPQNVADWPDVEAMEASLPYPATKMAPAPLTGVRAPPSRLWRLDMVVWLMVWNTLFQICLAAFMWGMNRYDRPSWSTGLFVGLGMVAAAVAGIMMYMDGKTVKSVEGVPLSKEDLERLAQDREKGIWHYNNIKDKDLEAKKAKGER